MVKCHRKKSGQAKNAPFAWKPDAMFSPIAVIPFAKNASAKIYTGV